MAKPDLSAQNIPTEASLYSPTQPAPEEYKSVYKNLVDGLLYELAALPSVKDEPEKITHRLRVPPQKDDKGNQTHPGFYWEGSKEQFKATFEKS